MGVKSRSMSARRKRILRELRKLKTHPTASDFYRQLKISMPRLTLSLLCHELEALSEAGELKKLNFHDTSIRYDGDTSNHYHLFCLRCGRVDDLSVDLMATIDRAVRSVSGYEIIEHSVDFLGLCRECSAKEKKAKKG